MEQESNIPKVARSTLPPLSVLHLDLETYSPVSVKETGHAKYAENPDTDIMIIGWAFDDDDVQTLYTGDAESLEAFRSAFKTKFQGAMAHKDPSRVLQIAAHNYAFERGVWNKVAANPNHKNYLGLPPIPDDMWTCTASRARACGLPGSLDGAATALGLDIKKDPQGTRLINQYSMPDRNGKRISLASHPADLKKFRSYCGDDVIIERKIDKLLPPLHPHEQKVFDLDMKINDKGIPVNVEFLNAATRIARLLSENYEKRGLELTGYKPSQNARMLEWFQLKGLDLPNMQAKTIEDALDDPTLKDLDPIVSEMLEIRYDSSRAGPKKLPTIYTRMSNDNRVRGGFIYHGATTARWTATGIQTQNFGKTKPSHQDEVTDHIIQANELNDEDAIEFMHARYPRPLDEMSMSLRSVIAAPRRKRLIAADYSSIEARVLAWLAEEAWLVDAFHRNLDAYVQMATQVFDLPAEDIDDHKRFVGKQLVLGCGYSMSGNRFMERCFDFGVSFTPAEANKYVAIYRKQVPRIVKLWDRYTKAAILACRPENVGKAVRVGQVRFRKESGLIPEHPERYEHFYLTIELPSGRKLHYQDPVVRGKNIKFRKYLGKTLVTGNLYGGFIAQNITQAIARDLLCAGLFNVDDAGYEVVMHIHDDICSENDEDFGDLEEFEELMCEAPIWAEGLPVAAEGWARRVWRK